MKNKIITMIALSTLLFSTYSFAVADGAYMGLGMGIGSTQNKASKNTPGVKTTTQNGMAGEVFGGYQFNNWGAAELGFTHWANGQSTTINPPGSSVILNNSINLLGKLMVPISSLHGFVKGGVGFLRTSGSRSISTTTTAKPALGLGVGYDLSQNLVADVSYSQLFGSTVNTRLIALSISYHFVDVYCGQFLC